mmetsp:Transcript_31446/g.91936  ORF Transcript_31446/g.91936 Transcript_31446/m.91936 type:complete len:241 (+) Transcript_31446:903-1625(+)
MAFTRSNMLCVSAFFLNASSTSACKPAVAFSPVSWAFFLLAPDFVAAPACRKEGAASGVSTTSTSSTPSSSLPAVALDAGAAVDAVLTENSPLSRSTTEDSVSCWVFRQSRIAAIKSAFLCMLSCTWTRNSLSMRSTASAKVTLKATSSTFCCTSASRPSRARARASAAAAALLLRLSRADSCSSTSAVCFSRRCEMTAKACSVRARSLRVKCTFNAFPECFPGSRAAYTSPNCALSSFW